MIHAAPESERKVVGYAASRPGAAPQILADHGLTPEMFTERGPFVVMKTADVLIEEGSLDTLEVLRTRLKEQGHWEKLGGQEWWSELVSDAGDPDAIEYHATQIREAARVREAKDHMSEALEEVDATPEISGAVDVVENATADLVTLHTQKETRLQRAPDMAESVREDADSDEPVQLYTPFGFPSLDGPFFGWVSARLNVVAARPDHGKTAFADACLLSRARTLRQSEGDVHVIKFDLEQGPRMSRMRLVVNMAGLDMTRVIKFLNGRQGLAASEHEALQEAATELEGLPIVVDNTPDVDVHHIRSRLMSEMAQHPVEVAVVDYLGQMDERGPEPMHRMMNAIQGLHILARDLGIPIVALTQISRGATDGDGRPTLNDLAWSDDAAKKTSTVALLHQPFTHWHQTGRNGPEPDPEKLEVSLGKHKGPKGVRDLLFDRSCLRVHDPEDREAEPMEPDDELPF